MKFIKTSEGDYIRTAHIKKLSWNHGYKRKTSEGYETCFPGVTAELFDGDEVELAFFDDTEQGDEDAKNFLENLVAKLNAEEI